MGLTNYRRVITESSVWVFDLLLMQYLRLPRTESNAHHPEIAYTGEWDKFTAIEREGDRIIVHRPVPWGTGALRRSGPIIWDSEVDVGVPAP